MAKKMNLDFTNVKDGGGQFSKKHMPAGDYLAKVVKVVDTKTKEKGEFQWLFTIQLVKTPSATYPYYIKPVENQLWKLRNLMVAAGMNVPKKKVQVDVDRLVGKLIAVSLDDEEYNDKMQSVISATFPPADLEGSEADDDEDDESEDEVEEEEAEDEDEDEGDAVDAMDRDELKAAIKELDDDAKFKKSETDDDLRTRLRALQSNDDEDEEEEEEEEPEPPKKAKGKKKKTAKADDDDDELEELEIEEI